MRVSRPTREQRKVEEIQSWLFSAYKKCGLKAKFRAEFPMRKIKTRNIELAEALAGKYVRQGLTKNDVIDKFEGTLDNVQCEKFQSQLDHQASQVDQFSASVKEKLEHAQLERNTIRAKTENLQKLVEKLDENQS